jgi:hypothetical protein
MEQWEYDYRHITNKHLLYKKRHQKIPTSHEQHTNNERFDLNENIKKQTKSEKALLIITSVISSPISSVLKNTKDIFTKTITHIISPLTSLIPESGDWVVVPLSFTSMQNLSKQIPLLFINTSTHVDLVMMSHAPELHDRFIFKKPKQILSMSHPVIETHP